MPPLSVLDLSPVAAGSSGAAALRNSLDLAPHAERLGYTRYWVAEHHNLPSIASSAPEIMIGQIAAITQRIRVGSGGVMLPNHAPLMVAERFKVLEALFPGRIDLGLGRAPGTDPVTSFALRRRQDNADDFPERLQELLAFESKAFPEGHPFRTIRAMPEDVALPPIYLLGSSDFSAELSASIGAGFSFAHHFASHDAADAMLRYRAHFRPSPANAKPHAILAVHVVAADSDEEAEKLAATVDLNFVRRARGEYLPLESPETALAYPYTPEDRARIRLGRRRLFVGSPATVRARLSPLIEATQADEVMITTMLYDHAARKHSYALMAEGFSIMTKNLFADMPQDRMDEQTTELMATRDVKIERIVSHGQASPPGFWYDQDRAEWVILLTGSAGLLFEGEIQPRTLRPGDYLHIPAHARHRVAWTDAAHATVWLAVHHR